jgi:hypothetical protein
MEFLHMRDLKKVWIGAVLGVMSVSSQSALAGLKSGTDVYIGNDVAFGSLGKVRNSADSTQHIGCTDYGDTAMCYATDAQGVDVSCTTTDATHLSVIRSISDSSYLHFTFDTNGYCTSIMVGNRSIEEPKQQ